MIGFARRVLLSASLTPPRCRVSESPAPQSHLEAKLALEIAPLHHLEIRVILDYTVFCNRYSAQKIDISRA